MQPASPNFCRLIAMICQGVAKRHEGNALASNAGEHYLETDELLRGGSVGAEHPR